MAFKKLNMEEVLLRAVSERGYEKPTEIQRRVFESVVAGNDVLGCAQTGTGKTAAFALPMLQKLYLSAPKSITAGADEVEVDPSVGGTGRDAGEKGKGKGKWSKKKGRKKKSGRRIEIWESWEPDGRKIRGLVMTPTRELAEQVVESFRVYGKYTGLRSGVVYGGVKQGGQVKVLNAGIDVLVATPGRLFDLMEQGYVDLRGLEMVVLDEADRMLDMGFLPDVRRLEKEIGERDVQRLMFSATMPKSIQRLANEFLDDAEFVEIEPEVLTADGVLQSVYHVEGLHKPALLRELLQDGSMSRVLVFVRTKRGAEKLVWRLGKFDFAAESIHSDRSQAARLRALRDFTSGKVNVLVGTDIAARGLDVDDITHVVNYDLPEDPETYVHRIGRTGRAGRAGIAMTFCSQAELYLLNRLEKYLGNEIEVAGHVHEVSDEQKEAALAKAKKIAKEKNEKRRVKTRPGIGRVRSGESGKPGRGRKKAARKGSRGGGTGRRKKKAAARGKVEDGPKAVKPKTKAKSGAKADVKKKVMKKKAAGRKPGDHPKTKKVHRKGGSSVGSMKKKAGVKKKAAGKKRGGGGGKKKVRVGSGVKKRGGKKK
ncbi:DEAD/DEAH box helicase [Poriferisphaera sp. WC338]|uniref:DEAD/DEAH box helicase n=1 Tax=Poriferisphaera sp. WC338 TaxID=3425129 RepID=UPI003D819B78